ncbi:MAG: hypothetical protein R2834_18425 [Rhodothermales bacterium]
MQQSNEADADDGFAYIAVRAYEEESISHRDARGAIRVAGRHEDVMFREWALRDSNL